MGKTTNDVSVRGVVYDIVRDYCREKGVAISPEVTRWIDEHLDAKEAQARLLAEQSPSESLKPRRSKAAIEAEIRKHFTF